MPNNNPQGENQYTKGDNPSGRGMHSNDDKSSKSSSGSSGSHKSGSGRSSDDDKSGSHSSRQR